MADTLTTQSSTPATVPASTVIATDDCGASGHAQIVKLGIATDGSATPLPGDATHGLRTVQSRPATPTIARVATSGTSATLLASNTSRLGAVIFNDSLVVLYVKFGTTATATDYTYKLVAGATLELPTPPYTGRIDGILASSTGNAQVTELSA